MRRADRSAIHSIQRSVCQVGAKPEKPLDLVLLELLESSHNVCSGDRFRLSSALHPSLYKLCYESLSGVHSAIGT